MAHRVWRSGMPLALLSVLALAGCTTAEGTNAFTDARTFEREVMTSTLQGLSLVPKPPAKDENIAPRGPLVIPKAGAPLPAPAPEVEVAALPVDSSRPQVNTAGLSQADLQRLKKARVVDLNSISGRPMTDAEAKALSARLAANNVTAVQGKRPLYLPPEQYFTTVAGQDLVCAAPNGDLVPLNDPTCPPQIRAALQKKK